MSSLPAPDRSAHPPRPRLRPLAMDAAAGAASAALFATTLALQWWWLVLVVAGEPAWRRGRAGSTNGKAAAR